jgi:hypothetical protein
MVAVEGRGDSVGGLSTTTTEADYDSTDWEDLEDWTEDTDSEDDAHWEDDGDWEDEDKLENSETGRIIGVRKRREKSGKRGRALLLSWRQPTACNCSKVQGRRAGMELELLNDSEQKFNEKSCKVSKESTQSCKDQDKVVRKSLVQSVSAEDSGMSVKQVPEKDPGLPNTTGNPLQSVSKEDTRMSGCPVPSVTEGETGMPIDPAQSVPGEEPEKPQFLTPSVLAEDSGMPNSPVQTILEKTPGFVLISPVQSVSEKAPDFLPISPVQSVTLSNSLVQTVLEGKPKALNGLMQSEKQSCTLPMPSLKEEEMLGARRKTPLVLVPPLMSSLGGLVRSKLR